MLSTPDVSALEPKFGRYFGRAADIIITGHFYDVTITPAEVSANSTLEWAVTVTGLLTSDIVVVQKPTHQSGLGIVNARVSANDTLAITYMNTTGSGITPTSETYVVLAFRRERE